MTASVVADPDPVPEQPDPAAGDADPDHVTGNRLRSAAGVTLPAWWEPLASRVATARGEDFGVLADRNRAFWRMNRWPAPATERRAAVLILLGEQPESGPDVLIMQRAATLRDHAGQPAFPGGAADPGDADAEATALREAAEEVGLDPTTTTTVALLPRLWIPVSGFSVTPVLSWWHAPHPVHPASPREVAGVTRVPIAELVDPANRVRVRHRSGMLGPAFEVRGMLIWGFTAGVLDTLLELGGWSRPWDRDRVRDLPDQSR